MIASRGLNERVSLWIFIVLFALSTVASQTTEQPAISCLSSQLLCGGSICYDPATQYCTELGAVIQCIAACGNQCYNPSTQLCFNGTVCPLGQQLCVTKFNSYYGYQISPPSYQCYDPTYQACFNNTLCDYPSRSCNEQCLLYNQVCVNNETVCNITNYYYNYKPNQIKLCDDVCYDSATQQCVDEYGVLCIRDPSTQQCINQSSSSSQFPNTTSISIMTTSTVTTPTPSASSNCCGNKECTNDADCCVQGTECQCYRHGNQDFGSCLNPYIEPLCANGCLAQQQCRNDTDCCKCQCGQVTVTNTNGNLVTRNQCVSR